MQLQPSELLVHAVGGNALLGMSDLAFLEQGQEAAAESATAATAAGCSEASKVGRCVLNDGEQSAVSKQQQQQSRAGSSCGGRSSALMQQAASAAAAAAAAALEEDDMVLLGTLQGSFSMAAISQQLQVAAASSAAAGQPRQKQQQQCGASASDQQAEAMCEAVTARSSVLEAGDNAGLGLMGQCGAGDVEVFEVCEYGLATSECEDDCEGEVHGSSDGEAIFFLASLQ
jgi:hypothetical protein